MSHSPALRQPPNVTGKFARAGQQLVDLVRFAQELRLLADPSVAAVLVYQAPQAAPRSVVATSQRLDQGHTVALGAWLGSVHVTQTLKVPTELRRILCCFKALAVPIATPGECFGVVVVPTLERSDTLQRQITSQACDFALQLEAAERTRILERLRIDELTVAQTHLTSLPANGLKYA